LPQPGRRGVPAPYRGRDLPGRATPRPGHHRQADHLPCWPVPATGTSRSWAPWSSRLPCSEW